MFWLFLILPFLHDFKMSVCELIYEPSDRHFEIKVYLFTDDLTQALTGDPRAPLPPRETISQYVQQHLELYVNNSRQQLQFYSIRQKEEQTLLQFRTQSLEASPASIFVKNDLLLEKFSEQSNMVYLVAPGKSKQVEALGNNRRNASFGW
ncbi:MAG: hypothetical protein RL013_334 [Bacteroidota bacterium]